MIDIDPYNILKMEFPGIKAVITQYSDDGLIGNYVSVLENSLSSNNIMEVLYSLDKICEWYEENISKILSNQFVYNEEEHKKAMTLLVNLRGQLANYDFSKLKDEAKIHKINSKKVFIVHGHDAEAKISVARLLEKLDLEPIILHEQPDEGKTIIEKLETFTYDASFAIVLYTECDLGRDKNKDESSNCFRARQNVVFEHGLFAGSLGRKNVCALVKGNIEKPGDIDGIVYVNMDEGGAWKLQLCSNMKAAGVDIDLNKLI